MAHVISIIEIDGDKLFIAKKSKVGTFLWLVTGFFSCPVSVLRHGPNRETEKQSQAHPDWGGQN